MTDTIERLTLADYDELIPYLARAFKKESADWFTQALPTIYQPTDESMRCNYAVRREGKIAAVVGVFPMVWSVGGTRLPIAGIGGVSTSPDCRRMGLMRVLMDHVTAELRRSDYALSYLGGQRQRYRYWGWERAGVKLVAHVDAANIRHEPRWSGLAALPYEPVPSDVAILTALKAMHDRRRQRYIRPIERFYEFLIEWEAQPFMARNDSGQPIAYAVISRYGQVDELIGQDVDAALGLLRQLVNDKGGLSVALDPMREPLSEAITSMAEWTRLETSGNWQIFDWPATVSALLRAALQRGPLAPGRVVLGIEGVGSMSVCVDLSGPSCEMTDEPADIQSDGPRMMRLLFGPVKPSMIMALPPAAAVLDQWCPLPLFIGQQDQV